MQGLEADSAVADADNDNTAALWPALVILLVREGDVDLGNVIGGVWRRLGVRQHGLGVADDDDA